MGAQRNAYRMRVLGIALIMISLLGCVSALDESIEAGRTEMNEITPVPATELAEAIPPRYRRKMRVLRMRRPHVHHVFRRKAPVAAKYPKGWSADPHVREKQGREKARKHWRGDERTKKSAHREALR